MTDDALDPRLAMAERLDAALYARRLGLALTDGDVAILRGQADGELSEAGCIAHLKHSLEYSRDRALHSAWQAKHGDGTDNPHVALVTKLEELAARTAEDAATRNQVTADTPLGQFSTDHTTADPEALKSALNASVAKLERKQRVGRLTEKETAELERLRGELRGVRESLRALIGDRDAELREAVSRRARGKLDLRPHQFAGHPDAAGTEIVDDDGSGLADLMGDSQSF